MNWLNEYKTSLKNVDAEEPLDIYFYRPLAFIVVKSFYSLPLTPNHYSFFALVSGLLSAFFFWQGTEIDFKIAAFLFFMFAVYDCCDGMVARMKKNGSEFGRIVDGVVDYTVNIAAYVGMAFGIGKLYPDFYGIPGWLLVVLAGVSKAIHALIYDHYLSEYLSHANGGGDFAKKEVEKISLRLIKAKEENLAWYKILALRVYLGFTKLQAASDDRPLTCDPQKYCSRNLRLLKLWSMIAPAPHITALILAFLFNAPGLLFAYSIIFGNLWLLFMTFYQKHINANMAQVEERAI